MDHGKDSDDRTGVGTRRVFGYQWRHDMADGFPLLTTKKVHFHSIVTELLWFIKGDTNVKYLQDNGVKIWNEWADPVTGDLGPVYGKQWRDFGGVDQIERLIADIKSSPNSRRLIVSAWNPVDVPRMKLPPCHTLWQCGIIDGVLNLHLYARSIDSFLGLPFNIASYALLLQMIASVTRLKVGELIISFGDLHVYKNHFDQVAEQLARTPTALPTVWLDPSFDNLLAFKNDGDILLKDYVAQATIKAPIAV